MYRPCTEQLHAHDCHQLQQHCCQFLGDQVNSGWSWSAGAWVPLSS